ncbi:tryptophan-rich sensory protein [Polaribacter aestuariivivens]|uniref:Tryptophan-rich sensory protein n=1 Tax=Polaribacter aestuariivivens TaxID=2304626 RepID=A0A5S3N5A6_9FLAO|nr:tryptophan-rich sensory protein [Polaribacter aestuariivivens]TMM30541.1 tryptophan-rich sensory protein [Polaribacter aestuariivivens]
MKRFLQVLNGVAFISVVFINYLSNTGLMNNTTIGEISSDYKSLFTPAGYAFSIWGLIYLLLFGFIFYQGRSLFVKVRNDNFIEEIGPWFTISCLANSAWVFCWIYEYTGLSCICIFILLFSLLKIVINTKMELWDAPFSVILLLWWPFVIYSGWVTVASIANVSAYLVKIGWNGFGISPLIWTVIMISIATIINLIVTWKRNMREFALVGAWALIAIGIANTNNTLIIISYIAAAILIISSTAHAYKNRKYNPIKKLREFVK